MPQQLIPVEQARQRVVDNAPRSATERVVIDDALDRVLAEDVRAAGDTPPFPSSAMDGYAVGPGPAGRRLAVVAESRAGTPATVALEDGQAIRISTGASLPAGSAGVIRQEDVRQNDGQIETLVATGEGENVRFAGEDMRAGSTVVHAGTITGPAELGGRGRRRRSRSACHLAAARDGAVHRR